MYSSMYDDIKISYDVEIDRVPGIAENRAYGIAENIALTCMRDDLGASSPRNAHCTRGVVVWDRMLPQLQALHF